MATTRTTTVWKDPKTVSGDGMGPGGRPPDPVKLARPAPRPEPAPEPKPAEAGLKEYRHEFYAWLEGKGVADMAKGGKCRTEAHHWLEGYAAVKLAEYKKAIQGLADALAKSRQAPAA
jgi:hypothetical protein